MWGLQEGEEQDPGIPPSQTLRTLIAPPITSCFLWKPKWSPRGETDLNTPINQTSSERWHEGRLVTKGGAPPQPSPPAVSSQLGLAWGAHVPLIRG